MAGCSSGGSGTAPTATSTGSSAQSTAAGRTLERPTWAKPGSYLGDVDPSKTISIQVHFALRDAAAAQAELAAISDPDSPSYGQFLSDDEFTAKYGASDADVAAVRAHLEGQGLRVTNVPANRSFVAAEGTAAQVGRAFGTHLGLYQVGKEVRRAPVDAPTLPASIAPRVLGVLGLSSPQPMKPMIVTPRHAKTPNAANYLGPTPCSEWYGQTADTTDPPFGSDVLTYQVCGYKPPQVRQAYGLEAAVRGGNDGRGQAIAVVDAWLSPTLASDAQTYAAQNDPDYPLGASQLQIVQAPGTAQPPITDWYLEQTLDVEAAHTMAPGAKIFAVVAQSQDDQDLIAAINVVLDKKLATVVSNSYETQEEGLLTNALIWEQVATQAGLKGVGLYFSSGDSGDMSEYFGYPTISFPGSLPTITAVGGTALALGATNQRLWETGWENFGAELIPTYVEEDAGVEGDGGSGEGGAVFIPGPSSWEPAAPGFFEWGGGGGVSILFPEPSYQVGVVPSSLASQNGVAARVQPDVSMLGDPGTGFLVGQNYYGTGYEELPVGGTSVASPLFAATMALAQQNAGKTFGFANTLLYKASKKGAFHDILPLSGPAQGVVSNYGEGEVFLETIDYEGQSIHTTPGFDDVSGLGTPNGATFLGALK